MEKLNEIIEEKSVREILQQLSVTELTNLQNELRREKKNRSKPRGLRISAFIRKEQLPYVDIVLDWLFNKGYIKKKSLYNLCSFATSVLIDNVIKNIKSETAQMGT